MEDSTKVNGIRIVDMVRASRDILLVTVITVTSKWAKPMVKVYIHGLMEKSMMENGLLV